MALQFNKSLVIGGNEWKTESFKFYGKNDIWNIGGGDVSPTWQDVILSGNTALTLVNAKENGLNYVKLFGKCEQITLPKGYTALEYIQSSGTQYINTGVQGEAKVVIDCQGVASSSTSEIIIGSYTYPPSFFGQAGSTGKYGFNANALTDVDYTTRKTFTINFNDGATVQYDSTTIQYTDSGTLYTSANYALFRAMARSVTNYYYAKARIYSVTFEQNGVYVAKMYPAKRDSDNAIGMYDTVRNTFYTNAGTGAFIAGDEVTPAPDNPIDIICNNGTLKFRNKNGLPSGYIQLNYLACTGTQYVTTSYYPNTNTEYSTKIYVTANNVSPFGARWSGSPTYNTFGAVYSTVATLVLYYGRFNNDEYYTFSSSQIAKNTEYNLSLGLNKITFNNTDYSITRSTFTSTEPLTLGALNINGTAGNLQKGRIYPISISENGESVTNLIPCRRVSDSVLGIYDTSTNTFLTNEGTGRFTAGDIDYSDYELYADGTTETATIIEKNLFDKSTADTNRIYGYFPSSGTEWYYASAGFSVRIPCLPNTTYTARYNGNSTQAVLGFGSTDSDNTPHAPNGIVSVSQAIRQNNPTINTPITITTKANDKWLIVAYNISDPQHTDMTDNLQIEIGSIATDYEPYKVLGTATAEMLLAVSENYRDIQEVLTGEITRNVTVKVLDGTESWSTLSLSRGYYLQFPNIVGVPYNENSWCTHFQKATWGTQANPMSDNYFGFNRNANTSTCNGNVTFKPNLTDIPTVEDWKMFLANEYANGTPVIVVYPTSSSITETATPQPLSIQSGSNIITAEGSIDILPLEVSYKAGVSVTITEVQNAQLDNNVEVTING